MMTQAARKLILLAVAPLVTLVAACDRSPTDAGEHAAPASVELVDRATNQRLAWTHGSGAAMHWDGAIPHIDVGDELAVNVRFLRANGTEIPRGGEFTVRARLSEQADGQVGAPNIVGIDNHGDHVDLTGLAVGETHIVFMLWHGGHADFLSPPIAVEVESH
jgi:hypothetical protein